MISKGHAEVDQNGNVHVKNHVIDQSEVSQNSQQQNMEEQISTAGFYKVHIEERQIELTVSSDGEGPHRVDAGPLCMASDWKLVRNHDLVGASLVSTTAGLTIDPYNLFVQRGVTMPPLPSGDWGIPEDLWPQAMKETHSDASSPSTPASTKRRRLSGDAARSPH